MNGQPVRALIDTGCSWSIVAPWVTQARGGGSSILAVDGGEVQSLGEAEVELVVGGIALTLECLVVGRLIKGVDVILGMDLVGHLGGVTVSVDEVQFKGGKAVKVIEVRFRDARASVLKTGISAVSAVPDGLSIVDSDFTARFDGSAWTVTWHWREGQPPTLKNEVSCYDSTKAAWAQEKFDEEVNRWISEGWLRPCDESEGGVLPLMAVVQINKGKVRPVLDFRELNDHVSNHPGVDAAVCNETLRRWRRMPGSLKIIDLKSAYLQVRVDENLWPYQKVSYKGRLYTLTRLGFGLNCAPKIMSRIVKLVLKQDERVEAGTDSYIDDIIVNEDVVSVEEVAAHLQRFGLEAKPPENLEGGRVLGLAISRTESGELLFGRGNEIPQIESGEKITRRRLFSICGQLVGHYPIGGWLRVACSFVKRESEGERWEDWVGEKAQKMIGEVLQRVRKEDPVKGHWRVDDTTVGRVWCDASSIALGVALEIGGKVVEDMAWLRKPTDATHINVAELDSIVKGINLVVKWGLTKVEVMTDSATVLSWLNSVLVDDRRVKVTGMSEMLVRRRLAVVQDTVAEYGMALSVTYVQSQRNKADVLTRVSKTWLKRTEAEVCGISVAGLHEQHHFGVDRTLHLARLVDPGVSREEVERCVRACSQCLTVDPAPARHVHGQLEVEKNWSRLALDVTHFGSQSYLTLVDCGPSRFAIWRRVGSENAAEISKHLEEIFRERGPPDELLMDNSAAFRSRCVESMCDAWRVQRRYRAAYRPSGNGIVERHHRTIKARAVRAGTDPLQIVFWYNLAAKEGLKGESAPCSGVFCYEWRHPSVLPPASEDESIGFSVGDRVWVKPPDGLCTARWKEVVVTGVTSANNVSVDGVPRHVLDVRRVIDGGDKEVRMAAADDQEEPHGVRGLRELFGGVGEGKQIPAAGVDAGGEGAPLPEPRPARAARVPVYLNDYVW